MQRRPLVPHPLASCAIALMFVIVPTLARAHLSIIRQGLESRGALEEGDRLGAALAAGDFNGDGFDDLAMGSPGEDISGVGADAGVVIVSFGSATGITHAGAQLLRLSDLGQSEQAGAQFGAALVAADFNLDGYDDLAIGAPYEDVAGHADAGRFYVVLGGPSGPNSNAFAFDESSAGGAIENGDRFGASFAAGKFDANNYPDLAVGAPGEDGNAGAVAVNYFGSPLGNITSGSASFVKESTFGFTNTPGAQFGYAIAAGNLTGSSHDDLVIGVPFDNYFGFSGAGECFLLEGSAGGLTTANWQIYGAVNRDASQAGGEFGRALAIGHFFDADGYQSVAFGEPGRSIVGVNNCGRVLVVKGQSGGMDFSGSHAQQLTAVSVGSPLRDYARFGAVLAAGDWWDADGYDDVAIGAPNDGLGFTSDAGEFNIAPGAPAGPTGAGWWGANQGTVNDAAETGDLFGAAIAFGHFDDSGKGGFAVGAPGERYENTAESPLLLEDAGQVHVILPWRQTFGLSCRRSVAVDCEGDLVFSQKPFERVYIASTTKAMTLLVAAEHIQRPPSDPEYVDPNTEYIVPNWVANGIGGSQFGLIENERMTLIDLLYACLYRSGNDAAYAIADVVGDGAIDADRIADFVGDMNAKAAALGMSGSHFNNPPGFEQEKHGYDLGDHYSTAYDMALLSRAVLQNPLTREISTHLSHDIVRHFALFGYPLDFPWTINNFFGGMTIQGATGIKGGYTSAARITGLFSARDIQNVNDVIATTFTTDTLPKGASVANGISLLQLGFDQCSSFYLIGPLQPAPFRLVLSGLSTASGSARGAAADVPEGTAGDLAFDIWRQTGGGPANARVDLWYTAQVSLLPGASAALGIGPFWMHREIHILNTDPTTQRIRVTLSGESAPADYTLGPGEELVLPQFGGDALEPQFSLVLQNLGAAPEPVELAVELIYGFDLSGLGGPDTRPAFSAMLQRQGALSNEGLSILGAGRDPQAGSELFLAAHEPSLAVGVDDPTPGGGDGRLLSMVPPAPNPFRDRARLAFELRETANVEAAIYDVQGRRVRSWPASRLAPGHWGFDWDGTGDGGARASAGVYFYRMRVDGREAARGRLVMAP